jgi:hypothetical protein
VEPTNTHYRQRNFRPMFLGLGSLALAFAIGFPLLILGGVVFLYYGIRPYNDSVTWYYDEFRIVGSPNEAESLRAEGVLPQGIIVEKLTDRWVSPGNTILETGRRVELSKIAWESAIEMSPQEPLRMPDGEDVVQLLDRTGYGSSYITVHFERQRFKSLSAWNHVRIHNTANGQSLDFHAKWSDVERVFGKPKKKEKQRHYHNKWVNQSHTESALAVAIS